MKIIALIPTTGQRNIKYLVKALEKEVDEIEIYNNPIPIGVANARNQLFEIAVSKYSREDIFLMIDDDAGVVGKCDIRGAAELFDKDPEVGIINIPAHPIVDDRVDEVLHCYHPFLIRGDIIFDGVRYVNNSFPDETQFGLDVWLKGYKLVKTYKCSIQQHSSFYTTEIPCILSIVDPLYREGELKLSNSMNKYEEGLFTWEDRDYVGFNIAVPSSVKATEKAYMIHDENKKTRFK